MSSKMGWSHTSSDELLTEAERTLLGSTTDYYQPVSRLLEVIRRQDARIAALEATRAPHGPPLEGTGPLPLERKGE